VHNRSPSPDPSTPPTLLAQRPAWDSDPNKGRQPGMFADLGAAAMTNLRAFANGFTLALKYVGSSQRRQKAGLCVGIATVALVGSRAARCACVLVPGGCALGQGGLTGVGWGGWRGLSATPRQGVGGVSPNLPRVLEVSRKRGGCRGEGTMPMSVHPHCCDAVILMYVYVRVRVYMCTRVSVCPCDCVCVLVASPCWGIGISDTACRWSPFPPFYSPP
jgi:hypothetical protein